MRKPPIADFDSASAVLRATARYLRGKDFSRLGMTPALEPLALAVALVAGTRARLVRRRGSPTLSPRFRDVCPLSRGPHTEC